MANDEGRQDGAAGTIAHWVRRCHLLAVEKGWWKDVPMLEDGTRVLTPDQLLSKLMLVVSELSEAVEVCRAPDFDPRAAWLSDGKKPEGFGVEIADAVIRIFDLCGALGIDLGARVAEKHEHNRSRPSRHGGKRA